MMFMRLLYLRMIDKIRFGNCMDVVKKIRKGNQFTHRHVYNVFSFLKSKSVIGILDFSCVAIQHNLRVLYRKKLINFLTDNYGKLQVSKNDTYIFILAFYSNR